jgi:predicted RNA-binding protein with RPS1 domain
LTSLPSCVILIVKIVKIVKGGKRKMSIINIKDFPDDLHRKSKSEAALEGISLKALIIKALEEYLKKKKGGK